MSLENARPAPRIAIAFPADPIALAATQLSQTRFAAVAQALASAGAEVISAPFCDDIALEFEARIANVDAVLVWYNPFEGGRDRSRLNAALRAAAANGVRVSAHPDVIDVLGTKDVLHRTRSMAWGSDVRRYASAQALQAGLLESLQTGTRVLKQLRGQSGDGIWQVDFAQFSANDAENARGPMLTVRHAVRGSAPQTMTLAAFAAQCEPYFAHSGAMIDQAYQPRLNEGMIRCYMVGSRVAGFGEQLVNALFPAPQGGRADDAPAPGPRLYFPPDRADFQPLKRLLENEWVAQMCALLGLQVGDLPVLWDADFLLGPKSSAGEDTYVLCEINVSSVYPFPPSAMQPLVELVMARCGAGKGREVSSG